jgi:hypothetical protein
VTAEDTLTEQCRVGGTNTGSKVADAGIIAIRVLSSHH